MKRYRSGNKDKVAKYARGYRQTYHKNLRIELISRMGLKCVKCGFTDIRALQIDHKKGNAQTSKKGEVMYLHYLKHPEEIKEHLQILCANCNCIKSYDNKEHNGAPKKYKS